MSSDATRMLSSVFQGAESDQFLELRPISKDRGAAPRFFSVTDISGAAAFAADRSSDYDVYFGVVPRVREKGGRDDVGAARAIWVDCDSPESVEALGGFSAGPSIVVASGSGGNLHAYWLLDGPIDAAQAEDLNRRAAKVLGSDPVVHNADRILRLPDTLNHKHGSPTKVKLVELNGLRYSVADLEAVLPPIEKPKARRDTAEDSLAAAGAGNGSPTQTVLAQLANVQKTGDGWKATCPAHEDRVPSLSIGVAPDGRCLLHCFAGCASEAVVAAIGLTMADLFDDEYTADGNKSLASVLIGIAERAGVELFHDAGGTAYARVPVADHHEVWPIDSRRFKRWLRFELDRHAKRTARAEAVKEAVEVLSARADFHGPEREVHLRSAWTEDGFVYNLADNAGRVVSVTPNGWTVDSTSGVPFLRRDSVQPLPVPEQGGSIELLRPYVNVASEEDFRLIASSLLMAVRPTGPFPPLVLQGPQGSAKSTLSRVLKALIDPVQAPVRSMPKSLQDLAIMAASNSLIVIDNLSRLTDFMSDAFCRLATGGGFGTRTLYSNDEEFIFDQMRTVILNGIDAVVTRQDLLGRSIVIRLPEIAREARVDEATFWANFERDRPKILGAVLSAASVALASWGTTKVEGLRMADFARWAAAGAPGYGWTADAFVTAYEDNLSGALTASLEGSLLATVVQRVVRSQGLIEDEPVRIYTLLSRLLSEDERKGRAWPKNAQTMSKGLTMLAPALAEVGIEVVISSRGSGRGKTRWIAIRATDTADDGTHGTHPCRTPPEGSSH